VFGIVSGKLLTALNVKGSDTRDDDSSAVAGSQKNVMKMRGGVVSGVIAACFYREKTIIHRKHAMRQYEWCNFAFLLNV
jgi:hypothetical protein